MIKKYSSSRALHLLAVGSVVEFFSFYLLFFPVIQVAEPAILLLGVLISLLALYRLQKNDPIFKLPLLFKAASAGLSALLMLLQYIYVVSGILGKICYSLDSLLDLACIYMVCSCIGMRAPEMTEKKRNTVCTLNAMSSLCYIFLFWNEHPLAEAVFTLSFMALNILARIKYYLFLQKAEACPVFLSGKTPDLPAPQQQWP
ncbi:MAG: hypothetical protein Q4B50_05140 [Bacillota bacterium]|nr:hypothetical protein [Bacillota bacterium]